MSDRNPDHLEATTRSRFERGRFAYEEVNGDRFRVVVTCTWRDPAGQIAAFNAGRSNAKPGQSYHNPIDVEGRPHSYAVDFQLRSVATGELLEGSASSEWAEYERAAGYFKRFGFVWSGDWPRRDTVPVECGHVNAPIPLAHAHAGRTPEWPEIPPEVEPEEKSNPRPRYAEKERGTNG